MRYILITTLAIAFAALGTFQSATAEPETGDMNNTRLVLPLAEPKIIVSKARRQLALYSYDKIVRVYRIGLGFNPAGDKQQQGDGRTPEGQFYVCVKNASSRYYLSLGLSYPNKNHAASGLARGLITRAQYDEIINALGRKARPPWGTRLGGEIFIHGHGSATDWTLGCVALDNPDMKELFDAVPKGAAVTIEP